MAKFWWKELNKVHTNGMIIWWTFSHHRHQSLNSMKTLSKSQTASFMGTENNSYRIVKDYIALLIDQSWKKNNIWGIKSLHFKTHY